MTTIRYREVAADNVVTKGIIRDIRAYDGSLSDALTDIGSTECTLLIAEPIQVTGDLTVPENVTLKVLKGCPISIAAGVTLTVNSFLEAGRYQVFSGGGVVNGLSEVYPEWFGAVTDGSIDCTNAIQKAIDSLGIYGGIVYFSAGRYKVTDEITIPYSGITLQGISKTGKLWKSSEYQASYILLGADISGAIFKFTKMDSAPSKGNTVKHLSFNGNNRSYFCDAAVWIYSSDGFTGDGLVFEQIKGRAIYTQRLVKGHISNIIISGCGDSSKPTIELGSIDVSNYTQSLTITSLSCETNYNDVYFKIDQYSQNNKLIGAGFETDSSIPDTEQTYIQIDGDYHQLSDIHINRNGGTLPRIVITGSYNSVQSVRSQGIHGGDVFSITGSQNTISNIGVLGNNTSVYVVSCTTNNTLISNVWLSYIRGFEFSASSSNNVVHGVRAVNIESEVLWDDSGTNNVLLACFSDEPASVASAATITLPAGRDFIIITGTTNINTINGGWKERIVTLYFADSLTVNDGGNLNLAGNFTTSANDTLVLQFDGTNWHELSRSAN